MNDDWESEDYKHYTRMMSISKEEGYDLSQRRRADRETAEVLKKRFINEVGASPLEIRKFLKTK